MQELDKILEDIKEIFEDNKVIELNSDGTIDKCVIDVKLAWNDIKDIICKHMNDGWVPVEDRLPTREEFLKDDGRFILDDGNRRYQGLFDIYDGKFKFSNHISGIRHELHEDKCVIAWCPLPKPYHHERSNNHDGE